METRIFGHSPTGLPILSHHSSGGTKRLLVLGGVHGDEHEGVWTAFSLLDSLIKSPIPHLNAVLVPIFNVDGVLNNERTNSRGVDLNRNLPTQDWSPEIKTPRYHPGPAPLSEPENKALVSCINNIKPQLIISLHSWKPVLNVNGDCRQVAEAMAKVLSYPIDDDIGYPTPGCLGTFGAVNCQIPVLTVELERGATKDQVPLFTQALRNGINTFLGEHE